MQSKSSYYSCEEEWLPSELPSIPSPVLLVQISSIEILATPLSFRLECSRFSSIFLNPGSKFLTRRTCFNRTISELVSILYTSAPSCLMHEPFCTCGANVNLFFDVLSNDLQLDGRKWEHPCGAVPNMAVHGTIPVREFRTIKQ